MTESERTKFFGVVPEALFIALLTAGAYWLTFRYEAGYLSGFGLPPHLVEVSLQTTLTVTFAVSGVIWALFMIINLVLMFWPSHPAIQDKVFRVGIMLLFPFWHLFNYGLRVQDWIIYVISFVFIMGFELIWPLLIFRDKQTLLERFISDEIAESGARGRTIAGRIFAAFGPAAYSLLLLFILGSFLAHSAGRAKAVTQKDFFVFIDTPDIAVIRMNRDMILAIPFDRKTKILERQVVIRKIGTENVILRLDVDVGPLVQRKNTASAKPRKESGTLF